MREQLHPGFIQANPTSTTLQSLVNHILRHSLSDTLRQSDSSVVNEIPAELCMLADTEGVEPVIRELLATIVRNARKGRIHIRAERFRDIIILEIQDLSNYNGYALDYSLRSMEPMARKIGGSISIKGQQQLEATISLSFPNKPAGSGYDC